MSRIYLASSWRNPHHSTVRDLMKNKGHQVYDFKSKEPMKGGGPVPTSFSWKEIDVSWEGWRPPVYREFLTTHPRAASGFLGDMRGMTWADTCVMLLPCGRSAHLEAGIMKGQGKRLIICYFDDSREGFDPDLMYLFADHIVIGMSELLEVL